MALLEFTDRGIYCPRADVYLDPWKPVQKALITHGHSDHARWGHQHYLCTAAAAPVIQHRLNLPHVDTVQYGETIYIDGVAFSFHPAGHIPGSAQIRVEHQGEVWVFSGDYKLEADGVSEPFEPIRCHTFITESTFGLPVYRWKPQAEVFAEINDWWRQSQAEGRVAVLSGYTLGKSQRMLRNIDTSIGPIYVHGALATINEVLEQQGVPLPPTRRVTAMDRKEDYKGALVMCPPSAVDSPWMRRFMPYTLGVASGWMSLRGTRRRRGADRGFVLSDHADWPDLNRAIKETGASRVYVTHGYAELLAQWLREQGLEAHEVRTQYEGELGEMVEVSTTRMGTPSGADGQVSTSAADDAVV